ncbi:uncharacterized protein HMPREF1541_10499 [Cyphellophora europaea CBS 101466]|uniref:G domain-containing protein n=1 Tax=Cyphellophora europaea (strain CBS 101466) TaxID=1220924 RepID=W2S8R5_CYPE1|nr:uncharacterized protein HMPREF1541_10499 [Cyphellophora europaea CBS 101466]ETN44319.1 hypothetical protein HMPREF1541_10499 [Cyphellophora europaea CBS 101466]
MGGTGVGKSTFINVLAASSDGREKARVGHTLMSCTADVQIFPCTLQGRRFNLIDTPGFDDPRMSDVEILSRLVDYFRTRPIHGVIFLHRITDIRLSGSAIRTAQLIKHICGAEFFERVALVTGMWDVVRDKDREAAHRRLTELRNHDSFWRPFVTGRARSHSFSRRHRSTAEKVIKSFFDQQRKPGYRVQPLAVVSQIKALGTLAKTDAGLYLLRQHSRENNSDSRWSVQKR